MKAPRNESGMTLLVVLIALLVLALGVLASLRTVLQDAASTSSMTQRTKLLTASDAAMLSLRALVDNAVASGTALEVSGTANAWFVPSVSAPTAAFWQLCQSGKAACAPLPLPGTALQAWGTVHPTGAVDPNGCASQQYAAVPYVLTVLVVDPATGVRTAAQSIYKACIPADNS